MPEIKASDFGAWLRRRLAADTEIVRAAALEACAWGEADAVKRTREVEAVDQGQFVLAWSHRALPNGAELRNDAPYAAVIERGRRPGRPGPPLEPILLWVNRKLVKNGAVDPEAAHGVALAIRNAIHIRGTKPRWILRDTMRRMKPRFKREALRRLRAKR